MPGRHLTAAQVGADRIESAARAAKPPPGTSVIASELHVLSGVHDDPFSRSDQRVAALCVRRFCNQHACQGAGCAHRNHRRDADSLARTLDILGLPGTFPVLEDSDHALPGTRVPAREYWDGFSVKDRRTG
jgi:hypothetical protein